jgi:hypothetical protein
MWMWVIRIVQWLTSAAAVRLELPSFRADDIRPIEGRSIIPGKPNGATALSSRLSQNRAGLCRAQLGRVFLSEGAGLRSQMPHPLALTG